MIKKLVFIFFFFLSASSFFSQELVTISFQGTILDSENRQKIHGASLFLIQGEKYIAKSISEVNGVYILSAVIDKNIPFNLIVAKNNFSESRILVDLAQLDFSNKNQGLLKLNEKIDIDLVSSKIDQNRSSFEYYYSDKYFWDQSNFVLVADDAYRLTLKNKSTDTNSVRSKEDLKRRDSLNNRNNEQNKISEFTLLSNEAKILFKEKKYKDSYDKYVKAELIINNLNDKESRLKLLSELQVDKKKALKLKNSEDQVFKAQLLKAQKNYALGRKGYEKAKFILGTDPMKSRVNDPELILLSEKISNMESYYKLKDAAYQLVKLKTKNQEAIDLFLQTKAKADLYQNIMPLKESDQLKKTIDSLIKFVNHQNGNQTIVNFTPPSTQDQGTILIAPGDLYTGKDSDAYEDIRKNIENQKEEPLRKIQDAKNALEYENYYRKTQNASQNEDFQTEIKNQKDSIDLISMSQQKSSELYQSQVQKEIAELEIAINERNLYVENQNEALASKISDKKDELDSENYNEREIAKKQLEDHNLIIQNQQDQLTLRNKIEKDSEEMRIINQKKVINSLDYIAFQKDSISKSHTEIQLNTIQNKKDYVKSFTTTPNFLKNEAGILYEKNKMTEEIFKIKNVNGFVCSVICRRIVVDKNGFGVVYEQLTNENGKSFFTLNGVAITERIWFNESTGVNVIEK